MDAPEDRDIKLYQVSSDLFASYKSTYPQILYSPKDGSLLAITSSKITSQAQQQLEPFQEHPQLLDPHLPSFIPPFTNAFVDYIRNVSILSQQQPAGSWQWPLPVAIAKVLYTFIKIRGYKIISRFLPNEPFLLEPVSALFSRAHEVGIDTCWELRYFLLLWLSHLLLAPFDLSTISANAAGGLEEEEDENGGDKVKVEGAPDLTVPKELPSLCKRLLKLGIEYLSSSSNRENDAAALLLLRMSLRRDMRDLGLLDAIVTWGISVIQTPTDEGGASAKQMFLKTGVLTVLAGLLAQGETEAVAGHVSQIYELVQQLEDTNGDEWASASIRRLGMKVYRHVAAISLGAPGEETEGLVEDVIERLLNSLADSATAVRFGVSKSLAVVARKLEPEMAGDVLEAVMGIYDEDVFMDPGTQRKIFTAVSPERWHGATLTLATFLRQRAVRSTSVLTRLLGCIISALSFEQRRATFAVGGNVRDAACYAAWSLARSYTTAELTATGDLILPGTSFSTPRPMLQILATELTIAGCLDPLGNVRRASSAALQELIGRHPDCVKWGISLVQAVDYSAVALRRRSVIEVSRLAAGLDLEYWRGIVFGIVDGWRGVGGSDEEGRKLAATGLGGLVSVRYDGESEAEWAARIGELLTTLLVRITTDGARHVEIYHGGLWALSELLDGIRVSAGDDTSIITPVFTLPTATALAGMFDGLTGAEFLNPILRPDLITTSTSRLVSSLCQLSLLSPSLLPPTPHLLRIFTAILNTSLSHTQETLTGQAVLAVPHLFALLSLKNRESILRTWAATIMNPSNILRGPVLAIAQALPFFHPHHPELRDLGINAILAAAGSANIELRITAITALTTAITTIPLNILPQRFLDCLTAALNDYTLDTRGDIGSLVRQAAVACAEGLITHADPTPTISSYITSTLIPNLARLSLEKLDRLRTPVIAALSLTNPPIIPSPPEGEELHPISSKESFVDTLSHLLRCGDLRVPALIGLASATGAGSDSIMSAARGAFLEVLEGLEEKVKGEVADALVEGFRQAVDAPTPEERIVSAWMAWLGGVIDAGVIFSIDSESEAEIKRARRLFVGIQKGHFKSGLVPKLEGALRSYLALGVKLLGVEGGEIGEGKGKLLTDVVKKVKTMGTHPFPRVRAMAVDFKFLLEAEM